MAIEGEEKPVSRAPVYAIVRRRFEATLWSIPIPDRVHPNRESHRFVGGSHGVGDRTILVSGNENPRSSSDHFLVIVEPVGVFDVLAPELQFDAFDSVLKVLAVECAALRQRELPFGEQR